ncbi:GyrI-like domain-containing protein [Clostridium kluyveri]|uniref:GyrI-like domain-containing protein n=1 Tax=Clostridium kluyveri TaxID=1534 RepID=UPI003A4C82A7
MDINIEMISSYKIAYIRKTGPYGSENVQIMEQLKSWAREKNLFNLSSKIKKVFIDIKNPIKMFYYINTEKKQNKRMGFYAKFII